MTVDLQVAGIGAPPGSPFPKTPKNQVKMTWAQLNSTDLDLEPQRKLVNKFVAEVVKGLKEQFCATDLPTLEGQTDVTLIVSVFDEGANKKFVLKLSPTNNAQNAKINGKILELLGLKVPNFFISRNEDTSFSALWNYTKRNNLNQGTVKKEKANLVFAEAFPGLNLKQYIQKKNAFHLTPEQWASSLEYFGKLAIFDLAIGNHDRFFRLQPGTSIEETSAFCNAGNVMMYSPSDAPEEGPEIYTIDNGSYFRVLSEAEDLVEGTSDPENPSIAKECLELFSSLHKNDRVRLQFAEKIYDGIYGEVQRLGFKPVKASSSNGQRFPSQKFAVGPLLKGIEEGFQALQHFAKSGALRNELEIFTKSLSLTENQNKLMEQMNRLFYNFLEIQEKGKGDYDYKFSS